MARRRKRLGAGASRPHANEGQSNDIPSNSTRQMLGAGESRPHATQGQSNDIPNNSTRQTLGAGESRPLATEGQSNDIPNNSTINDDTDQTTPASVIIENLDNPSNGRKQVQVVNGLFDKSSACSREITKIFQERIDDTGYTWTKVSQTTKDFYFGEFKKHFLWDPEAETSVRKAWDAKASGRYADFFRDIRSKMVKPVFMSDNAWTKFTSHWGTSKYKEIQEKNTQNRLKGKGSSTHTGGSISFREHAKNLESEYKRPPTGFELFLHTHTSGHDKKTFINEKSKTINGSVLRLRQQREENPASAESEVDETTLYIAAASGAKKRNLYGAGSKRVDYITDSGNKTTAVTKVNDGQEKKSKKMERTINKLSKTLEIVCKRFNITLPDCDSDGESSDGGDARPGPTTSHSQAGGSEEDDHDSHMIVS
ncbi:hypothetical protein CTI12_AA049210 [Artemisia annua]|uniref:Transposase, Ptta/En/Spm, plant n=1 Tax=Artemisia annua TaxID=35608 RepID=A0A2U1QC88_ARTAN|nr:hypothetical protein CTI12_AA049210 [Artemisia annua]